MTEEIQKILSHPAISICDAARVIGCGRNAAYEAVRRGEIKTIRIGKRERVLTAPLRRNLGMDAAS